MSRRAQLVALKCSNEKRVSLFVRRVEDVHIKKLKNCKSFSNQLLLAFVENNVIVWSSEPPIYLFLQI